eukprot:scaffold9108_cov94-Skeletonema_marinoi.AAC.4
MFSTTGVPGQSEGGPVRNKLLSNWTLSSNDRLRVDEGNFLTWRSPCLECSRKNIDGRGIFCANFFTSKGDFPPCGAAYCGECYQDYEGDPFPVQRTLDDEEIGEESGFEVDEESKRRFLHGRNGDHVMGVRFECDVCNFRNINERDVVWNSESDLRTLRYIRRASLDVMWSRESGTVKDNFQRMQRDWKDAKDVLSIGNIFPKMGFPEMEDRNGVGVAVIMLHASRRKGRYTDNIQHGTARKTVTWYMNAYTAITEEDDGTLFAADDRTLFASSSPTRTKWFQKFTLGMKRRTGVIRKQDEAINSEQVLAVLETGEFLWNRATDSQERRGIANIMAFVVVGYGASLRGEEVVLASIRGIRQFWDETQKMGTCRDFCRVLIFQAGTNAPALAHTQKIKELALLRIVKMVPQVIE